MPPEREWKLRISDIPDALTAIQEYTAGTDLSRFAEDRKKVDAVVRNRKNAKNQVRPHLSVIFLPTSNLCQPIE